tara:strand:- start:2677 stop:3417 length:741 start_codon:yes stop_codon:yes gene_type:complete
MKDIKFICGMPRAGSTLLSYLLNQNKKIAMTANSILPDLLFDCFKLKQSSIFKNFPDNKSLNNVLNNLFYVYYKDWKASTIIDKGPWGTPGNLILLKNLYQKPKFIILYRPVLECLASFVKIDKPYDIDKYCEARMDKKGRIGKELWSIRNLLETKEDCHILTYKKLTTKPQLEINKICKFIEVDSFKLKPKVSSQLKINKVAYNDKVLNSPLHKLHIGKVKPISISVKKILPKRIIERYKNMDVL